MADTNDNQKNLSVDDMFLLILVCVEYIRKYLSETYIVFAFGTPSLDFTEDEKRVFNNSNLGKLLPHGGIFYGCVTDDSKVQRFAEINSGTKIVLQLEFLRDDDDEKAGIVGFRFRIMEKETLPYGFYAKCAGMNRLWGSPFWGTKHSMYGEAPSREIHYLKDIIKTVGNSLFPTTLEVDHDMKDLEKFLSNFDLENAKVESKSERQKEELKYKTELDLARKKCKRPREVLEECHSNESDKKKAKTGDEDVV